MNGYSADVIRQGDSGVATATALPPCFLKGSVRRTDLPHNAQWSGHGRSTRGLLRNIVCHTSSSFVLCSLIEPRSRSVRDTHMCKCSKAQKRLLMFYSWCVGNVTGYRQKNKHSDIRHPKICSYCVSCNDPHENKLKNTLMYKIQFYIKKRDSYSETVHKIA